MSARDSLLSVLDNAARLREEVAGRNLATAEALDAVATYVKSMGVDDPRLRTLEELVSVRDGDLNFRPQGGASRYLASLSQAVTPAPPTAVLDGLIRAAAVDLVASVKDELATATDGIEGSPLQRIARIAQRKSRLELAFDQLLRDAAARGVPWTVLADLSGLTRQTLANRYGTKDTDTPAQPGERHPSKGMRENPKCGACNHPRSVHKGEKCSVGACGCSGFLGAESAA